MTTRVLEIKLQNNHLDRSVMKEDQYWVGVWLQTDAGQPVEAKMAIKGVGWRKRRVPTTMTVTRGKTETFELHIEQPNDLAPDRKVKAVVQATLAKDGRPIDPKDPQKSQRIEIPFDFRPTTKAALHQINHAEGSLEELEKLNATSEAAVDQYEYLDRLLADPKKLKLDELAKLVTLLEKMYGEVFDQEQQRAIIEQYKTLRAPLQAGILSKLFTYQSDRWTLVGGAESQLKAWAIAQLARALGHPEWTPQMLWNTFAFDNETEEFNKVWWEDFKKEGAGAYAQLVRDLWEDFAQQLAFVLGAARRIIDAAKQAKE